MMGPGVKKAITEKSPQATGIYKDKDGIWISAYAPVLTGEPSSEDIIVEVNYKIDAYVMKLRKEMEIILLVCVFAFIITFFVSYKLIDRLVSAVEKLDAVARDLEDEKYDVSIDIKSQDEVGHLAETFDTLRISIRHKIQELKLALIREKRAHLESIVAITNAIESRDPYTGQHLYRVEAYAMLIGKEMKLSSKQLETLRYACYLHDIGKIGVTDSVLHGAKLSDEEWIELKKHSERGAEIIDGIQFLTDVKEVILYHQERYDGKGYPKGLKGDEIPLLSRIVSVADAFDAMTTDRSYKKKVSFKEAIDLIEKNAGTQFDPVVCKSLLKLRESIEDIANKNFEDRQKT